MTFTGVENQAFEDYVDQAVGEEDYLCVVSESPETKWQTAATKVKFNVKYFLLELINFNNFLKIFICTQGFFCAKINL